MGLCYNFSHLPISGTVWGVDYIELFPVIGEIEEAGPRDGEQVEGLVHTIDILKVQKAFDQVRAAVIGFEFDREGSVTLEGTYAGREVVVRINTEPSYDEDDEGKGL
jgi:hypothetical protein